MRNKRDIKLSFESNALVYNHTSEKLGLVAFNPLQPAITAPDPKGPIEIKADYYECDPGQVVCLPFTWFEKGFQIQASFSPLEFKDMASKRNQDRELKNFTINRRLWLFDSDMRQVLNPRITDPYNSFAKSMETEKGIWLGLEFALLDTRTEYG